MRFSCAPFPKKEQTISPAHQDKMGAGASSNADGKVRLAKSSKVSAEEKNEKKEGIGALDASDIKILEEAKEESDD